MGFRDVVVLGFEVVGLLIWVFRKWCDVCDFLVLELTKVVSCLLCSLISIIFGVYDVLRVFDCCLLWVLCSLLCVGVLYDSGCKLWLGLY